MRKNGLYLLYFDGGGYGWESFMGFWVLGFDEVWENVWYKVDGWHLVEGLAWVYSSSDSVCLKTWDDGSLD